MFDLYGTGPASCFSPLCSALLSSKLNLTKRRNSRGSATVAGSHKRKIGFKAKSSEQNSERERERGRERGRVPKPSFLRCRPHRLNLLSPPFVYRVISYYEDPGLTWLFTLRHIVTFSTLDVLTYCVITFNFASLNQNLAQKLISEWRFNSSVKQKWLWLQDGEKFQHVSRFMPITML